MAKRYGAMVVAAEHRFYGSSINDNGLQLDQLEHLSSQQGLVLSQISIIIDSFFALTWHRIWQKKLSGDIWGSVLRLDQWNNNVNFGAFRPDKVWS